eukprot:1079846_1
MAEGSEDPGTQTKCEMAIEHVSPQIEEEYPQYPDFARQFKLHCIEEAFEEIDVILDDVAEGFDESVILEAIADDIEIKEEDKEKLCYSIHNLFSNYIPPRPAPCSLNLIHLDTAFSENEMESMRKLVSAEAKLLEPNNADKSIYAVLVIGEKNHLPLLSYLVDTYNRCRLALYFNEAYNYAHKQEEFHGNQKKCQQFESKNAVNSLALEEFCAACPTMQELQVHDKETLLCYKNAMKPCIHRNGLFYCLPLVHKNTPKIVDSLLIFWFYSASVLIAVNRLIVAKSIRFPTQIDVWIIPKDIKQQIFDDDDDDYGNRSGKLRLLKQRSGHSSAPHLCAFHGRKTLLSTANDHTLRVSWIQRDIQCLSMGQRAANKHSIPRIKCIDSKMSKSRFWSNVVTVHNNDNTVRLWNTSKFKLIESSLQPLHDNKRSKANASCAIISHCGHFVYVGRTSGVIDKYNIESALHRLQIPFAHGNIVRSLHLSMFNNVLISLGGDGLIKFWNIKNGKCQHVIEEIANHNEVISRSCYDKRSNLLAVATDNLLVYLFDGSNGSLIRKLNLNREGRAKYYSHVTSMIFSPRCQWLLIATMDGSVRVYDLATGLIIDWFKFKNAVTSMSFAVNNTFLATTHCNTMGIHIWANKHHFTQPFLTKVGNKPLEMDKTQEKEMDEMDRAVAQAMKDARRFDEEDSEESDDSSLLDTDLDDVLEQEQVQHEEDDEMELPDIAALHLTPESALITMSSNPKSIWKNMGNWDLILQRNRPSMKVKKNVENIPFFIPTKLHHRYLEMDTAEVPKELQQNQMEMDSQRKLDEVKQRKKILAHVQQKYEIDLIKYNTCSTLIYFIKKGLNSSALKYLLSLNPSASDAEIHCIGINIGTAKTELMLAINFFIAQLETNRNFEHIQSFISLFLKVHCDLIIKHSKSLHFVIQKLKQLMQQKWHKINDLFQSNLCLVQFYSHIQQ